jgi:hypothetical protein
MAVDRRLIEWPKPRTAPLTAPRWPASRLGWIWPRSGKAQPDPACFVFFPYVMAICYLSAANKISLKMF